MSTTPLSVAVIGAGMAGTTHANAWRQVGTVFDLGLPQVRLHTIADAYLPFAEDAAQRYGYECAVADWRAVAEDPDIEIPVPDGDFPVRKRYPDEVRPAQIEVAKLLYGIHGIERADIEGRNRVNRRNVTAFGAPVMGFVFVHEGMLPWSAMDAGLMLQTLFLSAKSRGIDSCPVGILATWREPVEAEFEIPEGYRFITGFALGYADPEAPINAMQAPRPPIQLLEGK